MTLRHPGALTFAILLVSHGWLTVPAGGQNAPPQRSASAEVDAQEAARRDILESDRWRRTQRDLNEWLSVQQIYNADQVAAIKADLRARIAKMSPRELEDLLKDMEERLEVLTSREAEDARLWLKQFLSVARNPEAQLGRRRPDVLNMTASQIRQELQWLEQHRASRQQAHAAFGQGRALQEQSARGVQEARRQSQELAGASRSRAATDAQFRSQYALRQNERPNLTELRPMPVGPPIYSVSPWGTPIYWHPMSGQW